MEVPTFYRVAASKRANAVPNGFFEFNQRFVGALLELADVAVMRSLIELRNIRKHLAKDNDANFPKPGSMVGIPHRRDIVIELILDESLGIANNFAVEDDEDSCLDLSLLDRAKSLFDFASGKHAVNLWLGMYTRSHLFDKSVNYLKVSLDVFEDEDVYLEPAFRWTRHEFHLHYRV